MNQWITYNDAHMFTKGQGSVSKKHYQTAQKKVVACWKKMEAYRSKTDGSFFELPRDTESAKQIQTLGKNVRKQFDHLIVVGIGGSDLGGRAIIQALKKDAPVTFVSNPDPETVSEVIQSADWETTALNIISKSGSTLETLSLFFVLREAMVKELGDKHADHIFVTTERSNNPLHVHAAENGYHVIEHKENVGGRYSALSSVGLFPAAYAGIPITRILKGASEALSEFEAKKTKHDALRFALHHYLQIKKGRSIHVLMPYADRLATVGVWYRQLWAESLGKLKNGKSLGATPVAALGTIDQHSQIQLYNQGPDDKVVTFLKTETFTKGATARKCSLLPPEYKQFKNLPFSRIMNASLEGTAKALHKNNRPNGTLSMSKITPETIGALLMFYEISTVALGYLLGINPFDQPGVEEGKAQIKRRLLG